jgi:hypothetical protein
MDISADKYKADGYRPDPFLAVLHTLLGIVRWPFSFFTLTEADRSKAGIYKGGEGRDE